MIYLSSPGNGYEEPGDILGRARPKPEDIFGNISIINSGENSPGRIVLCNKIAGGVRSFYPDMLYNHPFEEGPSANESSFLLYERACRFFYKHNIFFFEVYGESDGAASEIFRWLEKVAVSLLPAKSILTPREEASVSELSKRLRLSFTMEKSLCQHAKYLKLETGEISLLKEYGDITPVSKNEGKLIFNELRKRIVE